MYIFNKPASKYPNRIEVIVCNTINPAKLYVQGVTNIKIPATTTPTPLICLIMIFAVLFIDKRLN